MTGFEPLTHLPFFFTGNAGQQFSFDTGFRLKDREQRKTNCKNLQLAQKGLEEERRKKQELIYMASFIEKREKEAGIEGEYFQMRKKS